MFYKIAGIDVHKKVLMVVGGLHPNGTILLWRIDDFGGGGR